MLQQAADTGIDILLKVPIVLLIVCVSVLGKTRPLPETRTKIVKQIYELTIERTILKNFNPEIRKLLDDLLFFSWGTSLESSSK